MLNTWKILAVVAMMAFTVSSAIGATVAVEDFDGGTPSWSNNIASQIFVDPTDSDQGLFIQAASSDNANFAGNSVFGKDTEGESGEPTLGSPYVFTFDDVDTSNYENIVLSFDYAVSANADTGDYIVVLDGVDQVAVEYYNDPDSGVEADTISVNIGTANTVGLRLEGDLNGASDTLELDNFELSGDVIPEPATMALVGLGGLVALRRRRA